MRNYNDPEIKKQITQETRALLPIDICLATYNRLPYLQKTIWSLIASAQVPYNIYVGDDGSTDGTIEFLKEMVSRGLITKVVYNNRLGSAENFNSIVKLGSGELITILTDDKWIHRGWDLACLDILTNWKRAVGVNFFNYTRLGVDQANKVVGLEGPTNLQSMWINKSGMGATMMYRRWFYKAGKFIMPKKGKKMGFFATPFCQRLKDNGGRLMSTHPVHYATDMDIKTSKLKETEYIHQNGYFKMRLENKGAPNKKDQLSKK